MTGNYSKVNPSHSRIVKTVIIIAGVIGITVITTISRLVITLPQGDQISVVSPIDQVKVEDSIPNDSEAAYDVKLLMNEHNQFTATAKIMVTNRSSDEWDKLVFYMIPHVFIDKSNAETYRESAGFAIWKDE